MNPQNYLHNKWLQKHRYAAQNAGITQIYNEDGNTDATEFIRFEEKRERYKWISPQHICFAISADHYVKSLIQCGKQKTWMKRHSTLKELLDVLPAANFMRLNKFYLINLNYFSHINETERMLYFNDGFSITIPHRISPFLRHLLKTSNR